MNTFTLCTIAMATVLGAVLVRAQEPTNKEPQTKTPPAATKTKPVVTIVTSVGEIKLELWADMAPITVSNFLSYINQKFYDSVVFHRVIDGFMIQGGGFTAEMQQKPTAASIRNEARAETPNKRGTIAMARTSQPHSASSQFFINLVDNPALDFKDPSPQGIGYCVFGKVIDGMSVVDAIGKVKTGAKGPFQDVPIEPVIIKTVKLAE